MSPSDLTFKATSANLPAGISIDSLDIDLEISDKDKPNFANSDSLISILISFSIFSKVLTFIKGLQKITIPWWVVKPSIESIWFLFFIVF